MKANVVWEKNYQFKLDNGRGHEVKMDQPKTGNGDDTAPSPYEYTILSLAGCISYIFLRIAEKSRVTIESLEANCETEKGTVGGDIAKVVVEVKVKSDAPEEKLQKLLEKAVKNCPVGVIFHKAGIPVEETLTLL